MKGYFDIKRAEVVEGKLYLDGVLKNTLHDGFATGWSCRGCKKTNNLNSPRCFNCREDRDPDWKGDLRSFQAFAGRIVVVEAYETIP
jgi:hypothetical protein